MIKSGAEYLEGLNDGRIIYVGGERVDDVTTHPGFRNAARSYARIYDARSDERLRDMLTYEESGERYATYFLKPRTREDLLRRTRACRGDRRPDLRHDGTVTGFCGRLHHRRSYAGGGI